MICDECKEEKGGVGEFLLCPDCISLQEAAPDLLNALKQLADWPLKSECDDGSFAVNAMQSLANVRRFARQAVAKAEKEE